MFSFTISHFINCSYIITFTHHANLSHKIISLKITPMYDIPWPSTNIYNLAICYKCEYSVVDNQKIVTI